MDIGNAPVTNYANESYGTISLQQAFAVSSNVVFGQVANEVGANTLVQFANAFGYGQKLGQDLTSAASIMADPSLMTEWETAWAGAGQPVGMDHTPGPQTTVMQNAVIAAAIANSGVVMDPYFVAQVLAPDGTVVKTTQSRSLGQAVSSATATRSSRPCLPSSSPHRHRYPNPRRQGRRQDRLGRDWRHQRQLDVRWLCTLRFTHSRHLGGLRGLRQA